MRMLCLVFSMSFLVREMSLSYLIERPFAMRMLCLVFILSSFSFSMSFFVPEILKFKKKLF